MKRFKNLSVINLKFSGDLDALAERSMSLSCNIVDGEITLLNDDVSINVSEETWK